MMSNITQESGSRPESRLIVVRAPGLGDEGKVGELKLEEFDIRHSVLPRDPNTIKNYLQLRMGFKNLHMLDLLIDYPGEEYTARETVEAAGHSDKRTPQIKKLFSAVLGSLDQTPFCRHIETVSNPDEPNGYIWQKMPKVVLAPAPIETENVSKMVEAHLLHRAPFPVLPYDAHHRGAVQNALKEGQQQFTDVGRETGLRVEGVKFAYGLLNKV